MKYTYTNSKNEQMIVDTKLGFSNPGVFNDYLTVKSLKSGQCDKLLESTNGIVSRLRTGAFDTPGADFFKVVEIAYLAKDVANSPRFTHEYIHHFNMINDAMLNINQLHSATVEMGNTDCLAYDSKVSELSKLSDSGELMRELRGLMDPDIDFVGCQFDPLFFDCQSNLEMSSF